MSYLAKNNTLSFLAAGISSSAVSLSLQSGQGDRFPVIVAPDYTFATIEDTARNREIIKVTARAAASDTLTIERGQEGTVARGWNAGDIVELRMIARLVEEAMAHTANTSDAHHASAIVATPVGDLAGDTVAEQLAELDSEKEPKFDGALNIARGGTGADSRAGAVAALGIEAAEITVTTAVNATTNIGAAAGMNILLTTTATSITGFASSAAGVMRKCRASTGGFTMVHSATFDMPADANLLVAAGDQFEAYSFGSGWRIRNYLRSDGTPVVNIDAPTKAQVQGQVHTAFTTAGTATAYTLTPSPAISDNAAKLRFRVSFHAAAGATPTLAVSGKAALALKYFGTSGIKKAVTATQIPAGWTSDVEHDGTDWVVLNPANAVSSAAIIEALGYTPANSSSVVPMTAIVSIEKFDNGVGNWWGIRCTRANGSVFDLNLRFNVDAGGSD